MVLGELCQNTARGLLSTVDGKENPVRVAPAPIGKPVPAAQASALSLEDVRSSITCNLCRGVLASALVLQCSHTFCGHCLFEHLNQTPSCPTCQVSLRAIPVRCLALDSMVQAFAKTLPKAEADAHTARVEEGRTAANKLNKLYWYLQPQVPLTGIDGMGGPCPAPGMPGAGPMMSQLGQQQPLPQHTQGLPHMRSRVRSASYGGPGAAPPSQMQQQQQQACQMQRGGFNSMGGGPMGVMGMGGGPGAPGMGPMGGAPPRPPMAQQLHANQLGALQHQQHQQQQQLNAALAAAQAQQQQQQQLQSLMGAGDAMQQALLAADYSSAGLPPMHPGSSLQAQLQLQAQLLQQLYLN